MEIEIFLPITDVYSMYTPYHEMDILPFDDAMTKRFRRAKTETNLQIHRTIAGITQAELASRSGVSLRSLRQYEQRSTNINNARAETLLRLARALHCTIEDLIEKV